MSKHEEVHLRVKKSLLDGDKLGQSLLVPELLSETLIKAIDDNFDEKSGSELCYSGNEIRFVFGSFFLLFFSEMSSQNSIIFPQSLVLHSTQNAFISCFLPLEPITICLIWSTGQFNVRVIQEMDIHSVFLSEQGKGDVLAVKFNASHLQ